MTPAHPLNTDSLNTEYCLGIDLGGSSVKAVAVTREGQTLARFNESFGSDRPMHFAETIRDLVERVEANNGAAPNHKFSHNPMDRETIEDTIR